MRVIAIIGILLCHSCFEISSSLFGFGKYLGMTFNFLFLTFSAFLLGFQWEKQNYKKYKLNFIWKRIIRLSRSYYPYLVVLFVFLYLSQNYFNWKHLVSHFLYLPWFDKIKGYGHLWFLTMIVICYLGSYLLTKIQLKKSHNAVIFYLISLTGIILAYSVNSIGLPGNLFLYLIGFLLIYKNATSILRFISYMPLWVNILQSIIINTVIACLFIWGIYDVSKFISGILGMISACSLFCLLYQLFKNIPQNSFIEYIANISFEIYLVHEFFLGKFSVYGHIDNPFIGFIVLVVLSICVGAILHYLSSLIHITSVKK